MHDSLTRIQNIVRPSFFPRPRTSAKCFLLCVCVCYLRGLTSTDSGCSHRLLSTGSPLIPLQITTTTRKATITRKAGSRQLQLQQQERLRDKLSTTTCTPSLQPSLLLVLQWPKSYAVDGILTTGTQPMSKQQMSNNNRPFILQR